MGAVPCKHGIHALHGPVAATAETLITFARYFAAEPLSAVVPDQRRGKLGSP